MGRKPRWPLSGAAAALTIAALVGVGGSAIAAVPHGSSRSAANQRVFDIVYRGSGEFGYDSKFTDEVGCSRTVTGDGEFAFDQTWHVRATIKGGAMTFTDVTHLSGPASGVPGENHVHLVGDVRSADPVNGVICRNAGTFDCTGANLTPRAPEGPDFLVGGTTAKLVFLPMGVDRLTGQLSGKDSVPSPDNTSCSYLTIDLPTPFSGFTPDTDAWGKIPVKEATLASLRPRHYFRVKISAGHYTVAKPSKYDGRSGCLGLQDHDPHDYCTVSKDDFAGAFSVRRVR